MNETLKHNVFIVWKQEYNLGIPIIDEQHRGIVTIINSLYYGIQNKYIEDILVPIVDMIKDYTQIHFQIEEIFLEQYHFPDLAGHHSLHDDLIAKLAIIGNKSMLNQDPFQFLDFLKKWWIDHICAEDQTFRDFLYKQNNC